eukprot:GFKZ01006378.1.p1 GENE.GFKZ01006378.1~~GFKZ01006378.1.p1  ORF type:complete len:727 (-),score=164.86 GFKZ01006378.1:1262-3442(-)
MPQTRSRREADAPRPRRRAAANASRATPNSPVVPDGTMWNEASGQRLVGAYISVYWEPDDTYYPAMVLSYNRRKRNHKLIYMEDESVEDVELGDGVHQRKWKQDQLPPDPLVGKIIVLEKEPGEDEEWFENMKAPKDRNSVGLNVLVVSKYDEMPDEDEISHPIPPDLHTRTDQRWYRIINVSNEYLATVDLAYVPYSLPADQNHVETTRSKGNRILPMDSRRPSKNTPTQADDEDEGVQAKDDGLEGGDDEYVPVDNEEQAQRKDDDAMDLVDDEDQVRPNAIDKDEPVDTVTPAGQDGGSGHRGRAKRSGKTATDDVVQVDVDMDPTNVTDDEDDGGDEVDDEEPEDEVKADDMIRALDDVEDDAVRAEPRGKAKGEGSAATQETHDDPLEPNGTAKRGKGRAPRSAGPSAYPRLFDDGDDGHTASDEEKLGWVPAKKEQPSRSQVGDYISLDLGGGKVRKAFVEAYMPEADKHFLAFCDAEGGNLQIKLTEGNHTVLKDDEVDELNRAQMLDSAGQGSGAGSAIRSNKRRRQTVNLSETKTRKKRDVKTPPIRGERAGSEVCGRCLKIVWPGSDMVYTALVMGYNKERDEHQVVYLSDQCVETMELKYREWNLLAREDEPWITQGMLGKRLYVYWDGEYALEKDQQKAKEIFGEETKVAYEAYVLSYEGDGSYMIIYPNSEDKEVRDLKKDESGDGDGKMRDWGILKEGVNEVRGLPVVGWEP